MTLKCKIKEVSELKTEQDFQKYQEEEKLNQNDESEAEEEQQEDDFVLEELGSIEELSFKKSQADKRAKER